MTHSLRIAAKSVPHQDEVLTPEALTFVGDLVRTFRPRVKELLARRAERQRTFDTGTLPDFLAETADVRNGDWTCAPIPEVIADRRVEITGPVERKMIINALNSGANVFMADFEDATTPTWSNLIDGQKNLFDAVRRTISFEQAPPAGAPDGAPAKKYALNDKTAVLFVRPRGWHLPEKHLLVDDEPAVGGLFDFGLFFFHNAKEQVARGAGPFFYLPKMESHLEARLWNDVFVHAQNALGIPQGTVKATCLIETLPAAFEMDEFLHELRQHSAGLNCGRWDYIFSFIKKRAEDRAAILPDRGEVTMDKAFLAAYVTLLIDTCHRRGVHAMGGMAAQIPIKGDDARNAAGAREGEGGQAPRGHERSRRHVGRAPRTRPDREGRLRCAPEDEEPAPRPSRPRRRRSDRPRSSSSRTPAGARIRGPPSQHSRRHSVPRGVASWSGLRPDLRPHGRRGDGGDFARPGLAVDPPQRLPR